MDNTKRKMNILIGTEGERNKYLLEFSNLKKYDRNQE